MIALFLAHGREHELKPMTLDHEMKITGVHLTLELATRAGPIEIVTPREGESLRDTFEVGGVFGAGARKVTIRPDAFFQMKPELFFEVDRSTMPTKTRTGSQRFRDKVEWYRSFMADRLSATASRASVL